MRHSRVFVMPALVGVLFAGSAPAAFGAPVPRPHPTSGATAHRTQLTTHRASKGLAAALGKATSGKVRLGVVLRTGARPDEALAVARQQGGAALAHRLDALHYLSLSVPRAAADRVASALAHRADVERVEVVPSRHVTTDPNDPYYSSQQSYLTAVAAPTAWGVTHGSSNLKVAVIDTGVDLNHPDLTGKVAAWHNAMATALDPSDVTDDVGHGTHVAGIIGAATGNGTGVAGAGYDTTVLAVKAGDDTGFTDDDISAGIQWAVASGARVINMSLGGPTTSTVLSNAVAYAEQQGVLVVAAAGNDAGTAPSYPAALAGVVAVGATDAIGNRADFSNYGSWVTVGAPGVGIWSTIPTAGSSMEPGNTTGYAAEKGTSMASPIVAAEAALLLGRQPTATAAQVRSAIVGSAHGYSGLGLGTGQVDFAAALDRMPPTTVPTLTAPGSAALVGGTVTLTASTTSTSPNPTVRFLVDGVAAGAPVAVSSGTAGLGWQSWGTPDGSHAITVQDCNDFGCGQASSPVTVTVQNAAPTITSPSSGAVVGNVVGIDVTTQNQPPKVQLLVDGVAVGAPVAVTADAAHLSWPSYGFANGSHSVGVAVCTDANACGSSSAVSLDLENAAPAITAPAVGQVVSGPFTLSATAPGGALRFLVGGQVVGTDTTSPYSVAGNFSSFADGGYTLVVQSCTVTLSACSGPSASRSITLKSLHPGLASAPSVFSPNGDTRADVMTGTVSLPDAEKVYWSVRNGAGTVVRGNVLLGYLAAGKHTFTWNGLDNASHRVPDGLYTVSVLTSNATTTRAPSLYGTALRQVRVDDTLPAITAVSAVTSTFYPYPDGYRDSISPRVTVNEPGSLSMIVKNSAGTVVRTLVVKHSGAGTVTVTWNGVVNGGLRAPAGTYRYSFLAEDPALNRRGSATYSVPVSAAKLVGTAVVKVVTPAATKTSILAGSCSAVAADSAWSGGYDYLSDWLCYDPYDSTSDIAGSDHSFTLPAAIKYSSISVAATGQEDLSGYGDEAFAWFVDTAGGLVGDGVVLGSSYGTRSLGTASPSLLYGGRTLRWTVATDAGMYYDVQSFTVRYTYYVLK